MRKLIAYFVAFMVTPMVFAGGYQLNLLGQRQIGMGHTGTAISYDASATVFNPGALVFMRDTFNVQLGINLVKTNVYYKPGGNSDYRSQTENPTGTPINFHAAYKLNDKMAVGLSVYNPYGSSVVWEDDWKGRFLIQDIQLQSFFFQPTFSYKLTDKIGLGVGLVIAYGKVDLNKDIPVQNSDGTYASANLKGSTVGYGFNAGIQYKPTEKLHIGLDYRSKVNMKMRDGDANFTNVPTALASQFPASNKFDTDLPLPSTLTLGVGYNVSDKLLVTADVSWVNWSVYDSLIFDFKENTSSLQDSRNARKYNNAFIYRVGAEYAVKETIKVRLGYYYDQSPVKSNYLNPETPDVDKMGFTFGLGVQPVSGLTVDLSMLYIHGIERSGSYEPANFSGTYRVNAFIPGIGLGYTF